MTFLFADIFFCLRFDQIMSLLKLQSDIDIPVSDLKEAMRELEQEEFVVRVGSDGRNPTYRKLGEM